MQNVLELIDRAYQENWEELDLSGMDLTELPIALFQLTGFKSLILGREEPGNWKDGEYVPVTIANQIITLPPELGQLENLRSIEFSGNLLGEFQEIVFELKELKFLGIICHKFHYDDRLGRSQSVVPVHQLNK